ncbi:hypothetical protein P389DRAFT_53299 [Cystobasidium minutum MCA 4210]|uniref:uncharacterized protein n=1 Tax=Cystobasidium minutum MCA 4210 TaxID=1397322 RepID=UPI0034CD10BA|eukprot:jgi/Rhomi1/53299/CE53298_240
MIKSFFGLSLSDTSASSTSSSSTSSVLATDSLPEADASPKSASVKTPVTNADLPATPVAVENNPEEAEIDEETIKEAVQSYADEERLAPFRTKQILKKVLKPMPPNEPAPDECCGSACDPCVKDLWREEVRVWKIARGIDPYGIPSAEQKARYPNLDW